MLLPQGNKVDFYYFHTSNQMSRSDSSVNSGSLRNFCPAGTGVQIPLVTLLVICLGLQFATEPQMIRNNKSLLESKSKGFRLFYFEKPKMDHLIFKFEAEYDSHSYSREKNSKGIERKIIKFKLKIM